MKLEHHTLCVLIAALPLIAHADTEAPVKSLGIVSVSGGRPTSLPTHIPTTMEGTTGEQIEATINATDSEDALKYFPSLLVRKRYIGDYNHAVLSSRASGTGNSARSAVYADGILLSNYLGNGASYTPRWGMVTPDEIERVDVMYGPFSAAYPGNSVGAVVDYVTRMPDKLEAHAKFSMFSQPFNLYGTNETFKGKQGSVSLGNRSGDWSWWINANRTDSNGQPMVFVTKAASVSAGATPVTGAVAGTDRTGSPINILGTTTQYHTLQDHAKFKLAYDVSPTMRLSYTLGVWDNTAEGRPQSYLRNAAGNPVYTTSYGLAATDFSLTNEKLEHYMHGISLKTNTGGLWDWEAAASLYDYTKDQLRTATVALPGAFSGGAGTITDQQGTGWKAVALRGTWRPQGIKGDHIVDFGYQQENYALRILKLDITGNWMTDSGGTTNTDVGGKTQLRSVYAQDTWKFSERWKTVLGARLENWQATSGYSFNKTSAPARVDYNSRSQNHVSPKAALAYQLAPTTVLKASTGRAVRMPTVQELYGATSNANLSFINDPSLKPEKSVTTELSAEQDIGNGLLRATLFHEDTKDSLYSQLIPGSTTTSRVQNVDAIRTSGLELAYQGNDVVWRGFDFSSSLTYADSRIVKNDALPASVGKYQPRVPVWRATTLASYRHDDKLTTSLGWRYSGAQYSTLDNTDPNGYTYQGASPFKVVDLRMRYKIDKQWSAAFGIDNLTNYQYWNFHPYPQRTYSAELKFDL